MPLISDLGSTCGAYFPPTQKFKLPIQLNRTYQCHTDADDKVTFYPSNIDDIKGGEDFRVIFVNYDHNKIKEEFGSKYHVGYTFTDNFDGTFSFVPSIFFKKGDTTGTDTAYIKHATTGTYSMQDDFIKIGPTRYDLSNITQYTKTQKTPLIMN